MILSRPESSATDTKVLLKMIFDTANAGEIYFLGSEPENASSEHRNNQNN